MNYLHNAVHSFMKDHGIKPFELFHIRCDIEKDYDLAVKKFDKYVKERQEEEKDI